MNISAPNFLRRQEPTVKALPRPELPPSERRAAIVEEIERTAQERDDFARECDRWRAISGEDKRQIAFLERKLAEAEKNRHYYQVHSVALHTRLGDIASEMESTVRRIDKALSESQIEADARGATPPPVEDEARLQELAAKLAPEQTDAKS